MIKPDALGHAGEIRSQIKAAGFKIVASSMRTLLPGEVRSVFHHARHTRSASVAR